MQQKRVLVISAAIGGGHNAVAGALKTQLEADGAWVAVEDFYDAQIKGLSRFVSWFNRIWLLRLGWMYQWTWNHLSYQGIFAYLARLFFRLSAGRSMRRLLERTKPDVVVATYPMCVPALGWLRRRGVMEARLVARVTDFVAHALWLDDGVDLYLAANQETADWLHAQRMQAPIRVVDLPVRAGFLNLPEKAAAKRALGLDPARPVVLTTGGGDGVGHLDEVVTALAGLPAQLVVVCGTNQPLRRRVEALGANATVLGYVTDMDQRLAAADVLVGTPGPTSCCEAFFAATPVVTYRPYNGQGILNAEWVVQQGGGWVVSSATELRDLVGGLVADPSRLHDASARAGRIAHREHAQATASAVLGAEAREHPVRPARPRTRAAAVAVVMAALVLIPGLAACGASDVTLPAGSGGLATRAVVLAGILTALISSLCCNFGVAVQKRAALRLPKVTGFSARTWKAFLTDRAWLAGNGLTIAAWLIQCAALDMAPMNLVYPALASGIVFLAILAARWFGERLRPIEFAGAILCTTGIVLQSLSLETSAVTVGATTDVRALIVVVVVLAAAAGLSLLLVRKRPALAESALALSAGLIYAATGLLTKALTIALGASFGEVVLWGGMLALLALAALAILQAAYQRGRAVVVATIAGVPADFMPPFFAPLVFGESWPSGAPGVLRVLATAAILCGFVMLVRPATAVERGASQPLPAPDSLPA